MSGYNLLLILTFSAALRFWKIGLLPPINNSSYYLLRIISASFSLSNVLIIYFLTKKIFKSYRLALLSSFIFSLLPWSINEGRIISEPSMSLFFLLAIFYLIISFKQKIFKVGLIFLIPFIFYFFYPHLWIFHTTKYVFNLSSLLSNFFAIISFDNLFFKNNHFWLGGVRDYGFMYLSFLPFFITGIYYSLRLNAKIFLFFIPVILLCMISPNFPEGRELYFTIPALALIISRGFIYINSIKNRTLSVMIAVLVILLFAYDFSSFLHFYTVHYKQVVKENILSIHEPF